MLRDLPQDLAGQGRVPPVDRYTRIDCRSLDQIMSQKTKVTKTKTTIKQEVAQEPEATTE